MARPPHRGFLAETPNFRGDRAYLHAGHRPSLATAHAPRTTAKPGVNATSALHMRSEQLSHETTSIVLTLLGLVMLGLLLLVA